MPFQMHLSPIFGDVISGHGMKPDPQKLKALMEMSSKTEKVLHAFLGIINYFSKFSPSTADISESLKKLTSARMEWTWNAIFQKIFDKAKPIIKEAACLNFMIKPSHQT